jgi:hypothetical protein
LAVALISGPVLNEPVRAQEFITNSITARSITARPVIAGQMRETGGFEECAALLLSERAGYDVIESRTPCPGQCLGFHLHRRFISAESGDDAAPWTSADIVSAEDLSKAISSSRGVKPVILQVGIEGLYREAHIPDAIFAGPAAEPEGLNLLKSKIKGIPHTREIVIYCGCCPWKDCPNIRPAFLALHQLGFKKVKLLNIPTDFHQDWINKGFPTMRS